MEQNQPCVYATSLAVTITYFLPTPNLHANQNTLSGRRQSSHPVKRDPQVTEPTLE